MSRRPFSPTAGIPLLLLSMTAWTLDAQAETFDTSHTLGLSSTWLVRGIPLSREGTVVGFAGADVYAASGWSIGGLVGQMSTADGGSATPVNLRAGYQWSLDGRWTVLGQLRHLNYLGSRMLEPWCYNELALNLADADRWVIGWSAETRRGPGCRAADGPVIVSRSVELNGRWPMDNGLHFGGGLGRRMYGGGSGYLYGQAGGGWSQGGFKLLLDRVWVAPQARGFYGDIAQDRWVASIVQAF